MFLRQMTVRQNGRDYTYLKVVENTRYQGRTLQRTLLNFGNVSTWPPEKLDDLVRLLTRFLESDRVLLSEVRFGQCRQVGPYLPLAHLWKQLELDAIIHRALGNRKHDILVGACAQVMVLNRVVDPCSKKALWESLDRDMMIPGIDREAVPLHACYRSLEYLSQAKVEIEKSLHARLRHLFNLDLSLVFYDLTSSYFEGSQCTLARRGYSREHRPDLLQIEIGLLVDQEGIPLGHEIFEGNVKDVSTVLGTLERLKKDFGVKRCVFVGDDGMASEANLAAMEKHGYEYITSLSLRKSIIGRELVDRLPSWRTFKPIGDHLWLHPLPWPAGDATPLSTEGSSTEGTTSPVRYLASYNPERAVSSQRHRKARLRQCLSYLCQLQEPPKSRSRPRAPEAIQKAAERFVRKKECHGLLHLSQDPHGHLQWNLDRRTVRREHRMDGLLVIKTNSKTLTDEEVVRGYRTLWRVEDAFRHLKSPLELRPIRHWSDPRVRGHVLVCVLAYTMERLLDQALEKAGMEITAQAALGELRSIQVATLEAHGQQLRRRSEITVRQQQLLSAMGVKEVPQFW